MSAELLSKELNQSVEALTNLLFLELPEESAFKAQRLLQSISTIRYLQGKIDKD